MIVLLRKIRHLGRRLNRVEVANVRPLHGRLTLAQLTTGSAGSVRVLHLHSPTISAPEGELAELYEPVLTAIGNDVLRFRGFEVVSSNGERISYAQEWLCELAADWKTAKS